MFLIKLIINWIKKLFISYIGYTKQYIISIYYICNKTFISVKKLQYRMKKFLHIYKTSDKSDREIERLLFLSQLNRYFRRTVKNPQKLLFTLINKVFNRLIKTSLIIIVLLLWQLIKFIKEIKDIFF